MCSSDLSRLFAAYPLEEAGRVLGCVVLDLPGASASELQGIWRRLHWGSGRLETLLLRRLLQERVTAEARTQTAIAILTSIAEHPELEGALLQLANEIAARLGVERVAIGLERRGRLRLAALSHSAWFEQQGAYTLALENAMEEACDQSRTVVYPGTQGGVISVAHRALESRGGVCTVPLTQRGRVFGALTVLSAAPCDDDTVVAMEAIVSLVAPSLELRLALRRWFAGRAVDALRAAVRACRDPRRPTFRFAAAAVVLLALFLGFARGEHRVSGKAVIEGEVQRALAAPFDGFIAEAPVRAGQHVRAGQVLATLDDRDLKLDRSKWAAEREQADRKYRDALARHDRANARILAAQLAEANAQVALAEDKLARSQLRAPFDGVVVSGDLSQLLGTPVEKGKVLYEVAPLDAYRVIVKVPEAAIRHVRIGQQGRIVLAGISGEQLPFHVKNIGVAGAEEGENVFRVEAQLEENASGLRPGMEGVGKVEIGERRLVWIWTHTMWEWLRVTLWRWLP